MGGGLAAATANVEKNLKNARELFESYVDSVFQRQVDWDKKTLGAIAEFKNGLNFTKSSKGEKIRIVGVKDFQSHFWVPIDELESAQIDGDLNQAYLLRKNDILTVRSNGNKQLIGRTILAGEVAGKVYHSGFTIRIRIVSSNVDPVYLVRYLKSGAVRRALIESGDGAQISNLNQQALTALPVMLPKLAEQKETELVMNALKHAFPEGKSSNLISVAYDVDGSNWKLLITDNGVGKPDGVFAQPKTGLGTGIVKALANQLDARVETYAGPDGTAVAVTHATFSKAVRTA